MSDNTIQEPAKELWSIEQTLAAFWPENRDVYVILNSDIIGMFSCGIGYYPDDPMVETIGHTLNVAIQAALTEWAAGADPPYEGRTRHE